MTPGCGTNTQRVKGQSQRDGSLLSPVCMCVCVCVCVCKTVSNTVPYTEYRPLQVQQFVFRLEELLSSVTWCGVGLLLATLSDPQTWLIAGLFSSSKLGHFAGGQYWQALHKWRKI